MYTLLLYRLLCLHMLYSALTMLFLFCYFVVLVSFVLSFSMIWYLLYQLIFIIHFAGYFMFLSSSEYSYPKIIIFSKFHSQFSNWSIQHWSQIFYIRTESQSFLYQDSADNIESKPWNTPGVIRVKQRVRENCEEDFSTVLPFKLYMIT